MQRINNLQTLKNRRIELRKNPTKSENIIWQYLKNKGIGVKFRREHSISGYILDFYCIEKNLIIEVDGGVHNTEEAREYDEVRDKFFTDLDFKVLRFSNGEVENNIHNVIAKIKSYL